MTTIRRIISYFFIFLICLGVAAIITRYSGGVASSVLGIQTRAGLKITSTPVSTIFIDGKEVGKTPYLNENLTDGEIEVKLVSGQSSWVSKIQLNGGTVTVVNRELSDKITASSGEVLTLSMGDGIFITSNPEGASVEIDGKDMGKTPLNLKELPPGEHTMLFAKDGYLKRNIKAVLPEQLSLRVAVDLSFSDIDEVKVQINPSSDSDKIRVKNTPTGFLRVRATPSLTGKEVTRIAVGEQMQIIETVKSWYKVKLSDGKEGYVLSTYVEKIAE